MNRFRQESLFWFELGTLVITAFTVLLLSHVAFPFGWPALKKLPDVVGVYATLVVVFMKWAWRWRIWQRWLVRIPNLQGTWRGTIRTTWKDPNTGQTPPPIPVTLVIRQTLLTLSCSMFTAESDSYSTAAQINEDDDSGVLRLSYNYLNRPRAGVRERSEIHDGAAILKVVLSPSKELEGEYFTSRCSTGDIAARFHSHQLAQKHLPS
jgi:hypothetical protein